MKKLLTILLTVLMALTIGTVNVFADNEEVVPVGKKENLTVTCTSTDFDIERTTEGNLTEVDVKGEGHTIIWNIECNPTSIANFGEQLDGKMTTRSVVFTGAGTATVTATLHQNEGKEADSLLSTWVLTAKAKATPITFKTAPTANTGLTYTGVDQQLLASPAVVDDAFVGKCRVLYSLTNSFNEEESTDDITKLVGKDANNYTVYYKAFVNGDETGISTSADQEPVPVVINRANLSSVTINDIHASEDGKNCEFTVKLGEVVLTEDVDYTIENNSDMPTIFGDNTLTIKAKGNNFVADSTKTATYNAGVVSDVKRYYEGDKDYTTDLLIPVYAGDKEKNNIKRFHAFTTKGYLVTLLGWENKDGWHVLGKKAPKPKDNMEEAVGADEKHEIELLTTLGNKKYSFALGDIENCPHKDPTFVIGTTVCEATLTVEKKPTPTPTPKKPTYVAPKTGIE